MTLLRALVPGQPGYDDAIAALHHRSPVDDADVERTARAILDDVRSRGDAAVRELTERFDGRTPGPDGSYEVPRSRWRQAAEALAPDIRRALERAAERIRAFHERQHEHGYVMEEAGVRLELRVSPLARVGVYAPGGTARYPSSVLMCAVPARVAGVREIVLVSPGAAPVTLAAAEIAGVDRVFEIGGAQAIGALAYGTATVPRVDKIVGPGNQWVAAAKRAVFGEVDIDSIAGPSEVLIVADHGADARLVAADLLAQAEHDAAARPILVTTAPELIAAVERELARQLASLPRAEIARAALVAHGVAVVARDLAHAIDVANRYAAEHVELLVHDAAEVAAQIHTAGAVFVGPYTPEAAGDYLAGPNHVLPTGGSARWGSPLGVYDFRKRTSILEYRRDGLTRQVADISRLAKVEGLDAHARSAAARFEPAPEADEPLSFGQLTSLPASAPGRGGDD